MIPPGGRKVLGALASSSGVKSFHSGFQSGGKEKEYGKEGD